MKLPVFLSWSGPRSKALAQALYEWLPGVLQALDPWISTAIESGQRWGDEIGLKLKESSFGILCVTLENQKAPWLNFEAGACAKALSNARACPYLLDLEPSDLAAGPLTQFQAKRATREGTLDLVGDLNKALGENALQKAVLEKVFDRAWAELHASLQAIPAVAGAEPRRDPDEMTREILEIVRGLRSTDQNSRANRIAQTLIDDALLEGRLDLDKVVTSNFFRRLAASLDDPAKRTLAALALDKKSGLLGQKHRHFSPDEIQEMSEAFAPGEPDNAGAPEKADKASAAKGTTEAGETKKKT